MELNGTMVAEPIRYRDGGFLYSFIPDDEIPKAHRALVQKHVKRVSRKLGLQPVTVRYAGPARDGAAAFFHTSEHPRGTMLAFTPSALPWTFVLEAAIRGEQLVAWTVAHELRHVAQVWGSLDVVHERREEDADLFAHRYIGIL